MRANVHVQPISFPRLPPTPPQPQTNKATRFHQRAARSHLKDWLLAYEGQMVSVSAAARDNTGARRYIEGVRPRAHTPRTFPFPAAPPPHPHSCRATATQAARASVSFRRPPGLAPCPHAWAVAPSSACHQPPRPRRSTFPIAPRSSKAQPHTHQPASLKHLLRSTPPWTRRSCERFQRREARTPASARRRAVAPGISEARALLANHS
jgi:hypothetical protein